MLNSLRIKNLALVTDLSVELEPGYNAITGETGAGKSVLLGALNLVLGERADRALLRSGCDQCLVEAVFDVTRLRAPLRDFLDENGLEPCEAGQLILKRAFTAAGTNRQFINGTPTTLTALATVGRWLVDMHGPHDHQSLLQPAQQITLLDAFGGLDATRDAFTELVRQRAGAEGEKTALVVDEREYSRQLDLLRFQVNEIHQAKLDAAEESRLEADYRRATNAAQLLAACQSALATLNDDESSLLVRANALGRTLQELQRLDATAAPLTESHAQAVGAWRELLQELSRYADRVEVDPARLGELEERINLVQSLKRKYGATVADVITFGDEARRKLEDLEGREAALARIDAKLKKLDAEIARAGRELSDRRRAAVPGLRKKVNEQLRDLGFKQSQFDVEITAAPSEPGRAPGLSGLDRVEFQFSPNPGEPPRPLRAIASSGELARVMLALKTVLAAEDQIPVSIFDEVDANVGGETANAVGEKMRQLGARRQVICITHLAPVAARAAAHYRVTKEVKDGRTLTEIQRLDKSERVEELARMLGGQTEIARRHAAALLAD